MAREVFMTGGTGFLGRRLLAELLQQTDCRFNLLVRSPSAHAILNQHRRPRDTRRIRLVRGDVTLPNLGLDTATRSTLAQSVDEVWHLAASTSFDESKRDETFAINLGGTANLLGLLRRFSKLEAFYHMSTAYVCGKSVGCIPEGPFAATEGFKNPYEESKYEAECLLRQSGLPAVIIRPSITMGDSRTGDNGGDARMYYGYALGLLRAAMHSFESAQGFWTYWHNGHGRCCPPVKARLVGSAAVEKNLVTVDDVVSVCVAVRHCGNPIGRTFNLVNRTNLPIGQALQAIQRVLKVRGFQYDPSLTRASLDPESVVERAAFRYTRMYGPYTSITEPRWETDNVDATRACRVDMTEELFEFLILSFVEALAANA